MRLLFVFIVAFSLFSSTTLFSANAAPAAANQRAWQYRVAFDTTKFLDECRADAICSQHLVEDASPHRSCWKTLFALKQHFHDQGDDPRYVHTYHVMAKLLLSTKEPPVAVTMPAHLRNLDVRGQHISRIIEVFEAHVIRAAHQNNKLKKWSYIYTALLRREWANGFSNRRDVQLHHAFDAIQKAIDLKTTRTTHLIVAQLIRDDGFMPRNLTRAEADALADEHIQKAFEIPERADGATVRRPVQIPEEFIVRHARPPYLKNLARGQLRQNLLEMQPQRVEENDQLQGYDFSRLAIPTMENFADLPLRNASINRIGQAQPYENDARRLFCQDVSQASHDCFFNAFGFTRAAEVAKLREGRFTPAIRFMVANEILSMAENPNQLNDTVRAAINYRAYTEERDAVAQLQQERNRILRANPNQSLAPEFAPAALRTRIEQNDASLRNRALSLPAFMAFVDYLAVPGTMMGTLTDVAGNGIANFTAIDAVALANHMGVRIFGARGNLIHHFIPEDALEVQYLYHEGVHFQALLEDEADDNGGNPDHNCNEQGTDNLPSQEALARLYPQVVTTANSMNYGEREVRLILYLLQERHLSYVQVANHMKFDARRISEVARANGIKKHDYMNEQVRDKILESYLRHFRDIEAGLITKLQFRKEVAAKLVLEKISEKTIETVIRLRTKRKDLLPATEKILQQIEDAYRDGDSLLSIIKDHDDIDGHAIIGHLAEALSDDEFRDEMDLNFEKAAMSNDEREALIVKAFEDEKTRRKGETPTVLAVANIVKECGIGKKTVERILKNRGLVAQQIKARHLSKATVDAIRARFAEINPAPSEKIEVVRRLAKEFKVTFPQVTALFYLKNTTYSSSLDEIQAKRELVVATYNSLDAEARKFPVARIFKTLQESGQKLAKNTILSHLEAAGLYTSHATKKSSHVGRGAKRTSSSDSETNDDADFEPQSKQRRKR